MGEFSDPYSKESSSPEQGEKSQESQERGNTGSSPVMAGV